MADDWDDEPVLHMGGANDYDKEDINIDDVADDWDNSEPEEVEVKPEPTKKVTAEPAKKKTAQQLAREKELAELQRRKAIEENQKALEEEAKRKERSDPNYVANKKEMERRAILESENDLGRDLFGDSTISPSKTQSIDDDDVTKNDSDLTSVAARLANATGLSDGADGMSAINDPNARTVKEVSPLDSVDLSNKTDIYEFSRKYGEKLGSVNTKDGIVEAFKGLLASTSTKLKVEELTEIIRVLNIAKTEASKNLQGKKKKKANNKPNLKAGTMDNFGAFDDYDDYSYDRNGADPDFF